MCVAVAMLQVSIPAFILHLLGIKSDLRNAEAWRWANATSTLSHHIGYCGLCSSFGAAVDRHLQYALHQYTGLVV
jgi:hypothetical protein